MIHPGQEEAYAKAGYVLTPLPTEDGEKAWRITQPGWTPREEWGPGPWQDEPDKLQWITEAGLPGLIVRAPSGALCGYVGIPPDLKVPNSSFFDEDGEYHSGNVRAHGGITYTGKCRGLICHVPEPGQSDDVTWVGFDCDHCDDFAPAEEAKLARLGYSIGKGPGTVQPWGTTIEYRDIPYVRREVERLARQVMELQQ